MKRIILGISVLLMLVQNGFAGNNSERNNYIADRVMKQRIRCAKEARDDVSNGDVRVCLQAINLEKANPNTGLNIAIAYSLTGILYEKSNRDKIKAYKYYMKAAKLGIIEAQDNLDRMCKESPWACK